MGSIWSAPAQRSSDGALDYFLNDRGIWKIRKPILKSHKQTVCAIEFNPKRRRRYALPAHSKFTCRS